MKKKSLTRPPVSKRKSRKAQSRPKTAPGTEVRNIVEQAQKLHNRADQVHRQAESLQEEIEPSRLRGRRRLTRAKPLHLDFNDPFEQRDVRIVEENTHVARPFPIVGIGASAGGYESFSELLKNLPNHTGMAFVLVQHLDPHHRSQLTDLLGRGSVLPVHEVADDTEVQPNHVYVIPANANLRMINGRLRLLARKGDEQPPMPIDMFFRSLAEEQQDRAIGIVLSGTGTDGTLGIEAIKGSGGITFAQNENSAKYFGMPASAIGSGTVDFILSPKDIALELGRIARHPYLGVFPASRRKSPPQEPDSELLLVENEKEMVHLFGLLRARTGVDFSFYKHTTLKRRIIRQMVLQRMDTLKAYVDFLGKHPDEVDKLFNDLLINVTSFFRDNQAFQVLKRRIIPKLLKAHDDDSPLRCWVCGCSTGEEAYSLAISFVEHFEKTKIHRPVQIFASDISDHGITRARTGIYPENILQDVSPERLRRFFTRHDGGYQVNKSIRDMVIFARQNLIMDPPFSNLDLITCRNVLIYLGPLLQRKVLPLFHYALRPAGYLMLGSSETVGGANDLFSLVDKKHRIYSKKHNYARSGLEFGEFKPRPAVPRTAPPAVDMRTPDLPTFVDKLVLREYSPAAVVINTDLNVLHFRGKTGNFLEHPAGAANLNLLRMAKEGLVMDLRGAINKALKSNQLVTQTVTVRKSSHMMEIVLEVAPFQLSPESERFFLVMFRPTGHILHGDAAGAAKNRPAAGDSREVLRLKTELHSTRETLQTIIEEQEANNEELKSANEEIQSSNEELQSTNEELETAKEELQSTNEELTTLNEELQTRNTELGVALNDFTNLISSVNIAILILDEDLRIRRYTPVAERLFNMIPSDTGRRLSDLNRPLVVPDLEASIEQVISSLVPTERDVQDREGHWYSLRIRPYRTRDNKITGAVLVLVDIDHLRRALELVLSVAKAPLIVLGPDLEVRRCNDAFYKHFQLQPGNTEGRFIYEVGQGQWNILKLRELLENILPQKTEIFDYDIEASFPGLANRKLRLNARRFYDEAWGSQTILLGIEDFTERANR